MSYVRNINKLILAGSLLKGLQSKQMHSRPTIETNGEKRLTLLMKTEHHASAPIKLHPQASLQASRHDRGIRFLQVIVGQ